MRSRAFAFMCDCCVRACLGGRIVRQKWEKELAWLIEVCVRVCACQCLRACPCACQCVCVRAGARVRVRARARVSTCVRACVPVCVCLSQALAPEVVRSFAFSGWRLGLGFGVGA